MRLFPEVRSTRCEHIAEAARNRLKQAATRAEHTSARE
jgi:hypothetical protein